jgi:hypothetical protein
MTLTVRRSLAFAPAEARAWIFVVAVEILSLRNYLLERRILRQRAGKHPLLTRSGRRTWISVER